MRWLRTHYQEMRALEVVADRDEAVDVLLFDGTPQQKPIEMLAREIGERVQDEADSVGHQVRARVVITLGEERQLSTAIVARPNPDAMESVDATAVDALTGTQHSLLIQTQRHMEAYVRLSIEERRQTMASTAQLLDHVCHIVDRALARQETEEDRAEQWRQEAADLRAAIGELAQGDDGPPELPPQLTALLTAVTTRMLSSRGASDAGN